MIVRLQPLPDELDRSYLGALMRVNALDTEEKLRNCLGQSDDSDGVSRLRNPTLKLLSSAAGMDLVGFVLNHTTLPLRRSITSYLPDLAHGCSSNLALLHVSGKRSCREGAYLCQDCVWEDVDSHGRSYWRRAHQLPGVYWCAKHRAPLSVVKSEQAFQEPPSQVLGQAARLDRQWVETLQLHPAVGRFLDLCDVLMDRPRAFPVVAVRDALRVAARQQGLRTYATKVESASQVPLLSDALSETFPADWLSLLVPGLSSKVKGTIWHQVDGVLWTATSASAAVTYVLALAALFESATAAMKAIDVEMKSPRLTSRPRRKVITDSVARESYFHAQGSHSRLRRLYPDDWYPLIQAQLRLGLPGLPHAQSGKVWRAARAFYLEGLPLQEALALCSPDQEAFESLLLGAGRPFARELSGIVEPDVLEKRVKKRNRPSVSALDHSGLIDSSFKEFRNLVTDSPSEGSKLRAKTD